MRLILHTAAYWLLHTLRDATPKRSAWACAEFNTLRLRLIKIAARVVEGAAPIRVWLPTAENQIERSAAGSATDHRGQRRKIPPHLEIRVILMNRTG
jgi:hypothetical protein